MPETKAHHQHSGHSEPMPGLMASNQALTARRDKNPRGQQLRVTRNTGELLEHLGDRVLWNHNGAQEGDAMRNHMGQFVSTKQAAITDLEGFIADWKRWALEAYRSGNRDEGKRCKRELDDCRNKLREMQA